VVAFVVAGPLTLAVAAPSLAEPAALRSLVAGYGPLAPLVFVVLQSAQVLLAPVPGQVFALMGGFLFGATTGAAYSLVGMVLGSWVALALARRYGRSFVAASVSQDRLQQFDSLTDRAGSTGFLVLFLFPGLPDDAICFLGGLSDIPVRRLVAISAVGRAPSLFVASALGAGLARGQVVLAAVAGVGFVLAWVVGYRYRRRLLGVVERRLT
jgi:uncharacterized membrane protein YdjX (TVP38/TMEM64 family)